jgi:hypothetical protein
MQLRNTQRRLASYLLATTSFAAIMLPALAHAHHGDNVLEEVQVTGRRSLVGSAQAASEGYVTQEQLAQRPLLRTGEVLEVVPGLVATQHSGSGKANQFFLRGFNLDHGTDFATSVNGMPVNMRTHGHGQGYTDLNFVIPELIGDVIYRKGSFFSGDGDFAGTGSANMRLANELPYSQLSGTLGEQNYQRLLISNDFGDSPLWVTAELQRNDGPWSDIDEDVDKRNLWVNYHSHDDDNAWSATFMGYDNQWNAADQIPQRAVDEGIIDEFGSLDLSAGGESSRYSVSTQWQHVLTDDSDTSLSLYAINYRMNLWSNFTYFLDDPNSGDQYEQVDDRQIFGGEFQYHHERQLGGIEIDHIVGLQVRRDDIDKVGLYRSRERERLSPIRLDAVEETSAGIFWSGRIELSPAWRAIFGARHDRYDFEVNTLAAEDPASLPLNEGDADDGIATGNASLVYSPSQEWELYASIGRGFHSNDARGTVVKVDAADASTAVESADPLVATRGEELGARWFGSDATEVALAVWQLRIDSELIFVGDSGGTEDTGESSTRRGVELTTMYHINDMFTLDAAYAWSDSKFDDKVDGSRDIPGALEDVVSAGLTAKFAHGWSGALRARYFDEYLLDGGQTAGSSTLVNARIAKAFKSWTISADVLNLLDSDDHDVEYFYASRLQGEPDEGVEDSHFHVFEPRTVRVTAQLRW